MKHVFLMIAIMVALIVPAAAMTVAVDITIEGPADGYQCFTMAYQHPYDYEAPPAWEGSTLSGTMTVLDDRVTEARCRAWLWGPYDLQGNRTRVYGPLSDPYSISPPSNTPNKPSIILRWLVAVLDFFGEYFG